MVLKDLATFHAVPLALKLVKPQVFENKVRPHLTPLKPPPTPSEENGERGPQAIIYEVVEDCAVIQPFKSKLKDFLKMDFAHLDRPERPFFTIVHGDAWANNIMVKFENGKPVASKFVDFQNYTFRSPVADLIFLLWSSVQQTILEENFDELIRFYHDNFVENLVRLKCDPTPFSFEKLLEEIDAEAKQIAGQSMFMCTLVVFGKEGGFSTEDPAKPPGFGTAADVTPEAKERLIYILKICHEKGWL
ncbi:hypothetical protein NQ318_000154 [Aromia moschata]|uniref:CHK kinase-like domain-containing protein n=1 Tax=Aromia moschata TaxID=1265417 RepID=A0AAV8XCT3_9CUCU|nr:hypothetical protein NQ318_000154 [Aromia moschata]